MRPTTWGFGVAIIAIALAGCASAPRRTSSEPTIQVKLGSQSLCVGREHFYREQLADSLESPGTYSGKANLGRVDLALFTRELTGFNEEVHRAAHEAGSHEFLPDWIRISLYPMESKAWPFDVDGTVAQSYEPIATDDSGFRSNRKKKGCTPTGWPPADIGCLRDELKHAHPLEPAAVFSCVDTRCWMQTRLQQDGIWFGYSMPRAYVSDWSALHRRIRRRISEWAKDPSCIRPGHKEMVRQGDQTAEPEDSEIAGSLETRALLHYVQGQYAQAHALLARSLAIRERTRGPNHFSLIGPLQRMGDLLREQGRLSEAEAAYRRRIGIELRISPRGVAMPAALRSLAGLHRMQGRYSDAEQLHRAAVVIAEENWGSESGSVAVELLDLAALHEAAGRPEAAEPLYLRVVEIYENIRAASPAKLKEIYGIVATFYGRQGRSQEAARFSERANQAAGALKK